MISLAKRLKDAISILCAKDDYALIREVSPEVTEWFESQAQHQGIPAGLKFEEVCSHEYITLKDLDLHSDSEYLEMIANELNINMHEIC